MIKAVIFDMDGLLIDSEPLWEQAELAVFPKLGIPPERVIARETMGLRIDEMVAHWHSLYPWNAPSQAEVADLVVAKLIALVNQSGTPMAGVDSLIKMFAAEGTPMAIATSSTEPVIDAVLAKLKIHDHLEVIHSAQHEPYGKPHPGVYISAAEKLGVNPMDCLAFEDSPNGVLAAKAAKMKCVAVPEPGLRSDPRFGIADIVINSLGDFSLDALKMLAK